MKTMNHSYRFYFKTHKFIWNSVSSEVDFQEIIFKDDSLVWEFTVIAVSLGHPVDSDKRLIMFRDNFYWYEHKVLPIFEGKRVCGMEGMLTVTSAVG